MKRDFLIPPQAEDKAERCAQLNQIAAVAIPGTKENRAYHAKLNDIQRMALEIRAKRAGR